MTRKRILLIEDDFDVAEMLLIYFESHQYEIFHAEDGTSGLEMARTNFPNVILLDVMLPHMDGYEICHHLRQRSLTKYIPIIFLTQRDKRADRVRGLELGADDYITKPFDVDELRLRVTGSIRRATRISLHETRTGLPTGPLVEDELKRHGSQGTPVTELRFGIDNFSAYADVYGFIAADDAFGFAARCIQETISLNGTPDDFVGVRENHFIILTQAEDTTTLSESIQHQFEEGVKAYYNFMDVERGGVILNPGTAQEKLVALMSLNSLKASV